MGRRQAINVIQRATPLTSSTLVHKSQSVSAGIVSWVLLSATGRAQAPRLHSCTQLDLQGGLNGRTEGVTAKVSRQQQLPNAQDTQPSQLPGCAPDDRFVPAVWTLFHGTSASVNKICLFLFSPWEPGIQSTPTFSKARERIAVLRWHGRTWVLGRHSAWLDPAGRRSSSRYCGEFQMVHGNVAFRCM